jgi:hypothetical protein
VQWVMAALIVVRHSVLVWGHKPVETWCTKT